MLGNVFLHEVLDDWFVTQVQPRLKGRSFLIRFADDFVMGSELESDARRVMEVLPKRFDRFRLTIHPEKTKLVRFGKPASRRGDTSGNGTFDFLGFTHYWATSLRGHWVIKRKTARSRLRRVQAAFWQWCRWNRHEPVAYQHRKLCLKLQGYYGYYGIRGNSRMLDVVYEQVRRVWRYWLSRRSSTRYIPWTKFRRFLSEWPLPRPRIVHSV